MSSPAKITAETLKEFDELSEDVSISSRFMLVLACLQIECGYLEEWVAADALVCFPAVERDFRIEFAAASQPPPQLASLVVALPTATLFTYAYIHPW